MGDGRPPHPLHPDNDHITSSLHPGPLRRWRGGQSDLWLLCHPAGSVYSTVPAGDAAEGAEVFASLVSPLDSPADWSAAAAGDTCPASFLRNMHRT